MNALTDEQRQIILDEIIAVTAPRILKAYQFTRQEYQERAKIGRSVAQRALKKAVEDGLLKRELIHVGGKRAYVYWRLEDEPHDAA